MPLFSRGFRGRPRADVDPARIPPGQHFEAGFPVLATGPSPRPTLDSWTFSIQGAVGAPVSWTWEEFHELPTETVTRDIHCVTKWTKLDTSWTGVSVDTLLADVELGGDYVTIWSDGGYTTHLAIADLTGGKAWVVDTYEGEPLEREHGGPARLLVPDLYFWKSAKWVRGLTLTLDDEPGFWEAAGYHNRGDPFKEQRYWSD